MAKNCIFVNNVDVLEDHQLYSLWNQALQKLYLELLAIVAFSWHDVRAVLTACTRITQYM